MQDWIYCKDRLPDDDRLVVGLTMHCGQYVPVIAQYIRFPGGTEGWIITTDIVVTDIYAWCPMPDIPETY